MEKNKDIYNNKYAKNKFIFLIFLVKRYLIFHKEFQNSFIGTTVFIKDIRTLMRN